MAEEEEEKEEQKTPHRTSSKINPVARELDFKNKMGMQRPASSARNEEKSVEPERSSIMRVSSQRKGMMPSASNNSSVNQT